MKLPTRLALRSLVFGLLAATTLVAAPTIRVGYSYWLPNVPLDVAEAKGWWKDAGVQVELKRYDTTQKVIAALNAGELDLATDMIGTWIDLVNRGSEFTILGETDWSHGGDKILVKKDADLSTLKGGFIAVYIRNLAVFRFLAEHLRTQNLVLADFRILEIADDAKMAEAFLSGKVKGMVYYEPMVTELAEKGAGKIVATTADYAGVMPEGFAGRKAFVTP